MILVSLQTFKKTIWDYYKKNRRDFRWRNETTPYYVVVSEIMLQQTQAPRVVSKFDSFIAKFPDFQTLASAPQNEVLKEWQGLGYNRRGLNLKRLAETIITQHNGKLPKTPEELLELPGIGPGTVGSLLTFAFNIPHPFIETNIRSVFIHFFFNDKKDVNDKMLMPLITETLDRKNPREWYYALMDYGVMLKKLHKNPSRKSKHYTKQSSFKGSNRELRSLILKHVLENSGITLNQITKAIKHPLIEKNPQLLTENIADLQKEGFITLKNRGYYC